MLQKLFNVSSLSTSIGARIFILVLIFFTILTTAWIGDDAQITFRQVWNFINGDGITFNFQDRVQAFTHPLWFLILSFFSFFTSELFNTTIILNVVFSLAAILILIKIEYSFPDRKLVTLSPIILLLFSWAFIDYTTSGLENSLSYFLIGLLLYLLNQSDIRNRLHLIFLVLALLLLNRFDYAVLFAPIALLLLVYAGNTRNVLRAVWLGSAIILLWLVFATIYFGTPLPNTYYAKLNAGYPVSEIDYRGSHYFSLLRQDFGTVIIILTSFLFSVLKRNLILLSLSVGQIAYLYYIYKIGGDFMQGRYFSVLVYLSTGIIILAFLDRNKFGKDAQRLLTLTVTVLLIGICFFNHSSKNYYNYPLLWYNDYYFGETNELKLSDERVYYYKTFGLLSRERESWLPISNQPKEPHKDYRITCGYLGQISLKESSRFVIDICGLSDPFISRIPAIQNGVWAIGHHFRKLPTGYGDLLTRNIEEIPDENLHELLTDVWLVSRGELFSRERFGAIWRLNSNYHDNINLDQYMDTNTYIPKSDFTDEVEIKNWDEPINTEIPAPIFADLGIGDFKTLEFNTNLKISSLKPRLTKRIEIAVDNQHVYEIFANGKLVETLPIGRNNRWDAVIDLSKPTLISEIEIRAIGADYFHMSGPNAFVTIKLL